MAHEDDPMRSPPIPAPSADATSPHEETNVHAEE